MQYNKVKALVEKLMLCAVPRGIREALTAWDYVDEFELPKVEVNKQGSGSGADFTKTFDLGEPIASFPRQHCWPCYCSVVTTCSRLCRMGSMARNFRKL